MARLVAAMSSLLSVKIGLLFIASGGITIALLSSLLSCRRLDHRSSRWWSEAAGAFRACTGKLVLYQVMAVYLEILLITALLKVLLELISKLSQLFEANTVDFVWRYLLFIVIGFVGILLVQFSVFFYTHKLLKRGLEDKTITDDEVSYVKRLSLVPVVHVIALITLIRKKSKKGVPMPGTMTQLQ